jgi:predicted TIM-barrel fold metal-dependent hydrolase
MKRRNFLHGSFAIGLAGYQALRTDAWGATSAPDTATRGPIIDVHMHAYPADAPIPQIGSPAGGKLPGVKDGHAHMLAVLAEMKRFNIVKGIVSGGDGDRLAAAYHWHDAAPDRFIAGAGVRGSEEIPLPDVAVLREAFQAHRLAVLGEVTAEYAGLTLSDAKYEPYLALAEEFDIPVALHTGMGPPGISYDPCCRNFRASLGNPALIEEALNRHPKLRVNLMHAGWPYLQETIATLFSYPQVYVDLGALDWAAPRAEFHAYLQALVRAGFAQRVMFGSDHMYWPEAIGMAIDAVDSAKFLTAADRRDIFFNNAVRFYRLEVPGAKLNR